MLFSGEHTLSDQLLLVAEIGNTNTSFAIFKGEECIDLRKVPSIILSTSERITTELAPILMKYPALLDAALCSVVPSAGSLLNTCLRQELNGKVLEVTSSLQLPFTLNYEYPDTFGADRIALCALGRRLFPEQAVIALDIGTAITVDVLGSDSEYLGGLIMPGLDLMAKALNEHTARLPLVSMDYPDTLIGLSTAECIRNGIVLSCVSGIEGVLIKIKSWLLQERQEQNIRIISTGGNAQLISSMLSAPSLLDDLAVLKGTRYLFSLNAGSFR